MNKEEWTRVFHKYKENPSAILGLCLLIFFIIIAILAPVLAPLKIEKTPVLEKAKNNIIRKNDKQEIINYFNEFHKTMYDFYILNYDKIKNLNEMIIKYEKNDHEKKKLYKSKIIDTIKNLSDEYIIDNSYLKEWDKKPNIIIKDLKKEINKYKKIYNKAVNVKFKIDNLITAKVEPNFYGKANTIYKYLSVIYKKSLNINPYIMPTVTWNLTPKSPSKKYPFGICNGKNIYYGVIWGARTSFRIGLIVTLFATLFGLFIGSIASYYGGWLDEVLMRITDIFLSIPFMLSAIVLTTILGTGLDKVMIAMIIFGWMSTARLIRGNILQTKNEQYVLASKALGVHDWKIIIKHILPNTIFPVIVQASMRIGSIVITSAALSFLGIGAPQGYADWGSILSYARNWIIGSSSNPFQYWYIIFFPGLAMILFVLSWNLIGDALRDIFDPKLRLQTSRKMNR